MTCNLSVIRLVVLLCTFQSGLIASSRFDASWSDEEMPCISSNVSSDILTPFEPELPQSTLKKFIAPVMKYFCPAVTYSGPVQDCAICLEEVFLKDCAPCCKNGHRLHMPCFVSIILQAKADRHNCPLCRLPLIADSQKFHEQISSTSSKDSMQWTALWGHRHALLAAGLLNIHDQKWNDLFFALLTFGDGSELRCFLSLDLVDINSRIFDGKCALVILFERIFRFRNQIDRLKPHLENLSILFDYPGIILDRIDGKPPRHLIYWAIDANQFQFFVRILAKSSRLNLSEVFNYICSIPDRKLFFNYLLNFKPTFKKFGLVCFGASALQCAIDANIQEYVDDLLKHPEYQETSFWTPLKICRKRKLEESNGD